MFKNILVRFVNGFCYSIAITMSVQMFIMLATGHMPMLPEFMDRFDNTAFAFGVQLILVGVMSGVASAGSIIMELKKPGLVIQSVMYFLLMFVVWIPIACYLWSFHKYVTSMISGTLSLVVTYGICWSIQYNICKRDIDEINEKLKLSSNV